MGARAKPAVNEPILLRQDEAGVATLTLNRPRVRNSLSVALMDALQNEIDAIAEDPSVRVVVIGASGSAFCAGHDLKELRANANRGFYEKLFAQCSRLMLSITRLKKPVIAKVQGSATAAGCQLVATCDLAVATEDARFATPGVQIGLFCSTPTVALTRAVAHKHAMEMLFTGDFVDAEEALRIGLVNRVVPPARLDEEINALAAKIAGTSPLILATGKEAFHRQIGLGLEEAYAYASAVMTRNLLAHDAKEGIDAFLEKRAPVWQGR
ncbi:MAG: enoyl-CoA hydratase [Alphaproteobacteria bacterium]